MVKKCLLFIIAFALVLSVSACEHFKEQTTSTATLPAVPATGEREYIIESPLEVGKLVFSSRLTEQERQSNWSKYRGKWVWWTGEVEDIEPTRVTFLYTYKSDEQQWFNEYFHITVDFDRSWSKSLGQLSNGKTISYTAQLVQRKTGESFDLYRPIVGDFLLLKGGELVTAGTKPTLLVYTKADLIDALEGLKEAILKKIDSDIDVTATAFTDVKDYWRSKRWADIFTAPLRVLQGTLSMLSKATSLQSINENVQATLDGSEAVYQILGTVMMVQGLQEAGEKLSYGLYGPAYVSAVESMLEAADAVNPPLSFNAQAYEGVINNHLWGGFLDLSCPLLIVRKSTTARRNDVEVAQGALQVRSSITREFNDLIAEIESKDLPTGFPLDETVSQLKEVKNQIIKSMSYNADVGYTAYLGGEASRVDAKLGAVGELYRAFGEVAGRVDKKLQIEQRIEVLKLLETAENAALLYTITYKIPGVEEISIAQKATILAGVITKPYTNTFYIDSEKQFYMIPQEMLLSLPTELSNLWMIADDTDQYLGQLLLLSKIGSWTKTFETSDGPVTFYYEETDSAKGKVKVWVVTEGRKEWGNGDGYYYSAQRYVQNLSTSRQIDIRWFIEWIDVNGSIVEESNPHWILDPGETRDDQVAWEPKEKITTIKIRIEVE